jgi:hypothetical protein
MAHEGLYSAHSTYDPLAPWANSFQPDVRDIRDPEDIGSRILRVRESNPLKNLKTHELHDLLEEGRSVVRV